MKTDMKLSIVLTVYNKEPYLDRAFDSLLNQQNVQADEYEILVVNDGSTDGSARIVEDYSRRFERVRVLTQLNQGLSMARNNGTNAAWGDYVWYVDADDIISPQSVRLICDAIEFLPDVIPIYAKTEGIDRKRNCVPVNAVTGADILISGEWQACGVFYILRRCFLKENNLAFLPGIYHEDSEFTPRMLYLTKNVVVVPEVLYTVIHEPNSITQVPRAKRAYDCLIVAESLFSFIKSKGDTKSIVAHAFFNYISNVINDALKVIVSNSEEEQKKFNRELQTKPELIGVMLETNVVRYLIEGILFKLFPGCYTHIYKIIKSLKFR